MNRKRIKQRELASLLRLSEEQISRKINERQNQEFTRSEMYHIHEKFFPDTDMKYLFVSDK